GNRTGGGGLQYGEAEPQGSSPLDCRPSHLAYRRSARRHAAEASASTGRREPGGTRSHRQRDSTALVWAVHGPRAANCTGSRSQYFTARVGHTDRGTFGI